LADSFPLTRRVSVARSVAISLVCWAILSGLHLAGAFRSADLRLSDWRYRLRGPMAASDSIALIEVDDATITSYKRWPLLRNQYGALVHALDGAGAKAIGLDLLFIDRDKDNPESDSMLLLVTSVTDNLVHSIYFPEPEPGSAAGEPLPEGLQRGLSRHGVPNQTVPAPEAFTATLPFEDLLLSAQALGHVVVATDPDGTIRSLPSFVRLGGSIYPCLSLRLVGLAEGEGAPSRVDPNGSTWTVTWPGGDSLAVPVDDRGATQINFAGDRSAFPHVYSMLEVMRWYQSEHYDRMEDAFKGKIVLIGSAAVGQAATDVGPTPFSPATPLLYVHANAVDCFLSHRFLTRPPSAVYLPALAGVAVVLGTLFAVLPLPWALATVGLGLLGLGATDYALFVLLGVDVPPTAGLALVPLAYVSVATYQFLFLQRRARERQRELDIAREIQRRLLPSKPPEVPDLDIFGLNIPAREVGGDYYDWVALENGSVVAALGDVSGKGVGAALLVSHLYASFHAETRSDRRPREIVKAMHESLFNATEPGRFATFFLAAFSASDGGLCFCNAGHNPPLLLTKSGVEALEPTGVVLGIIGGADYTEDCRPFEKGDVLIVFSDGVTECTRREDMYGDERLTSLVAGMRSAGRSAEQIVQSIIADVKRFSHGHLESDDVTLLVIRRR
jgi:serine phosphatase RsbU (regulator of sigma subunit)